MRRRILPSVTLAVALTLTAAFASDALAGGVGGATSYSPGTPVVDAVQSGLANAPYNISQGDPSVGAMVPLANLLPLYTPPATEPPNLAVYPAASGATPYPSGVAGTPGPLAGYCAQGYPNNENSSPVNQPANVSLPFAPYYFPDVVRNADGSLTGYFDWRPKDADEALVVARSSAASNGQSWQVQGMALNQNGSYCPTADTNDDGEGHAYVTNVAGNNLLYTLQRSAGDYPGVGLIVHPVNPSASNPLASVPAKETTGIDPNTFVASSSSISVPTTGATNIPVSTLGSAGSPEDIVAGPYEDLSAPQPWNTVITCSATNATTTSLTGCTVAGASNYTVQPDDDLVQVIATANPGSGSTYAVPAGPNSPDGSGGIGTISVNNGNSSVSPLTLYIFNDNAPGRVYIDGATVYCVQSNANPTNKIENCTTTQAGGLTVHQGDAITADPIIPATGVMTSGLVAPDGIVGVLPDPSYPGAPAGSTVVLYTEKVLNWFISGAVNGSVTGSTFTAATGGSKNTLQLPMTTGESINYSPSIAPAEQLPASGTFTVYFGTTTAAGGGTSNAIQAVTCTGTTAATQAGVPAGSVNLTGCTGGTGFIALGNWLGGPGSAITPFSVLNQVGEGNNGASKGPEKLFGNNEDLTILRAAYTTDGVNFTDLGPISGGAATAGITNGAYTDVSNPYQQVSPSTTAPYNAAQGSLDNVELRYVGSRGTIVTNPDGSYGMFLSGAWSSDGDSDAFNQIFYTSSTDGVHWSTPQVVLSTDYTFAASAAQDAHGGALGISAYYEGRAYGPTVVQNPNGTLTMVFSGYRLPKPITSAGTILGTNPSAFYTIGANDPALYRNILTMGLTSSTSPAVATGTSLAFGAPTGAIVGQPVTFTATVSPTAPGTGTATGSVSFSDGNGPIAGCQNVALNLASPDTATCTTTYEAAQTNDQVRAAYSGDSNYASSTQTLSVNIALAQTMTAVTSSDNGNGAIGVPTTFTATVTPLTSGTNPPGGTASFSDDNGTLTGCGSRPVSAGVATCTVNWTNPIASDQIVAVYSGDSGHAMSTSSPFTEVILRAVQSVTPNGNVPSTLSLSVSNITPNLGAFAAGVTATYNATLGATVTTSAASSTLTAADTSSLDPGHLVNSAASGGPYDLPQGLQVDATSASAAATGGATWMNLASVNPATILSYTAPVSNDAVTIGFQQAIGSTDALRTGTYTKVITFTLSTSTP